MKGLYLLGVLLLLFLSSCTPTYPTFNSLTKEYQKLYKRCMPVIARDYCLDTETNIFEAIATYYSADTYGGICIHQIARQYYKAFGDTKKWVMMKYGCKRIK